jgi:zinc protease
VRRGGSEEGLNVHRPRCVIYLCVILLSYAGGVAGQKQPFTFPDEPPQAPPLRPASLPQPASETLDNGMEVITVYSDEVPYVSVGWFLMAGAKYDPPDKAGLATLTADLLRQGTSDHTADQIASTLDFHAIRLEGSATHEYSKVSAHCLSQYTDLAVEVMAEVIRRPTFPKDEFRRRAKEMISGLSVQERDPGYQADRHLHEFIYKSHYEARPSEGTTKTLRSITVDDVIRFHGSSAGPSSRLGPLSWPASTSGTGKEERRPRSPR